MADTTFATNLLRQLVQNEKNRAEAEARGRENLNLAFEPFFSNVRALSEGLPGVENSEFGIDVGPISHTKTGTSYCEVVLSRSDETRTLRVEWSPNNEYPIGVFGLTDSLARQAQDPDGRREDFQLVTFAAFKEHAGGQASDLLLKFVHLFYTGGSLR